MQAQTFNMRGYTCFLGRFTKAFFISNFCFTPELFHGPWFYAQGQKNLKKKITELLGPRNNSGAKQEFELKTGSSETP